MSETDVEHEVGTLGNVTLIMYSSSTEAFEPPSSPYVNLDVFAGQCAVSRAFKAKGYSTCSLDIDIDPRDEPYLS